MKTNFYALLAVLSLTACSPKIYKTDDFASVSAKHKIVAVLPSDVMIHLRPNEAKKVSVDESKKDEESIGYAVQDKMYGWLLRKSDAITTQ